MQGDIASGMGWIIRDVKGTFLDCGIEIFHGRVLLKKQNLQFYSRQYNVLGPWAMFDSNLRSLNDNEIPRLNSRKVE
ncbi:unnamed protein product [Arabis nemorensis]|uniref:Uncharacterized protein n=1 Tax=Arabis nemorensis TaxID=586526 RepID=A0A565ATQ0_9BRAS|nr:unnamed protein product [Arabis nemorensis]